MKENHYQIFYKSRFYFYFYGEKVFQQYYITVDYMSNINYNSFPKDFPKEFSAFKELYITDLCVFILLQNIYQ